MVEDEEGKSKKPKVSEKKKTEQPGLQGQQKSDQEKNVKERIQELKQDVAVGKEQLSKDENELGALEKAAKDIDKTVEAFGKAYETLKADKEDIDGYYENKKSMINAVVDEEKKQIEDVIKQVDKEITDKEAELEGLKQSHTNSEDDYKQKNEAKENAQKEYDLTKNFQKGMQDKLKELSSVRGLIEEEEEKNQYAVMYFYIDEKAEEAGLGSLMAQLDKLIEDVGLKGFFSETQGAKEKFEEILNGRCLVLQNKERELKGAEIDMQLAKEKLDQAQKELDELKNARMSKILEKLAKIVVTSTTSTSKTKEVKNA